MDVAHQLILLSAGLIFLSIFAGLVSSRVGAPLLLVFLALGMLAGKDGPGGIVFDDFQAAYTIGAAALAVILFDGGLRTSKETIRLASWPALVLATIGVVITAGLTGAVAAIFFGLSWLEGLLAGSIIASTDAAAVFFLLNLRGTNLVKRVSATLEAESGLNDPMAVFLTLTCVSLIQNGVPDATWASAGAFAATFAYQLVGGAVIGIAGGYGLLRLINALRLATGLYPILALSTALLLFAGAQTIGTSGFMAAYLAGIMVGTRRHRATQIIDRFQDGIAWLCQIGMFLMLGLLVTPSALVDSLLPALGVAAFLLILGRPLAVMLCLAPFGFAWREHLFVSWVGLRGGVPIFLGMVPILADLPNATIFFEIAFVIVLSSLVIQGWTVTFAARQLSLALPPDPEPPHRVDMDMPDDTGRELVTYTVQEGSAAANRSIQDLVLQPETAVLSVIRDGDMKQPESIDQLYDDDSVICLTTSESLPHLDRMFGRPPPADRHGRDTAVLGEFAFPGDIALSNLAQMYDIPIPGTAEQQTANDFMARHLPGHPVVGDRLRLGTIELIVRAMDGERIAQIGVELDPEPLPAFRKDVVLIWFRHLRDRVRFGL